MVLKELHNFDEDAQKSFLREVSKEDPINNGPNTIHLEVKRTHL